MRENDKSVLVYSTFPSPEAAEVVGRELVDRRLAACVNVVPGVVSHYRFEGRQHRDAELLLVIKTRSEKLEALRAALVELHPYAVPELVELEIAGGHAPYLSWLDESVG